MAKRGVGLVIERAEAVIEQVRARIGGKRAGYGQTLALTARDVRAALGDGRCQPLGTLGDELARLRHVGGCADTVLVGIVDAIAHVRGDGAAE